MVFTFPQLERFAPEAAPGADPPLGAANGHAHWSSLYAASTSLTASICWPSAEGAPTQAYSFPHSRPLACVIAASAAAQTTAPFARFSMAAMSWCSRIRTAFAPPPLPHALGLSWRMEQSWASERFKQPTVRLETGQRFS